jgi:hypothetical protein
VEHFNLRALKGLTSLLKGWHGFMEFLEEHGIDPRSAGVDAVAFRRKLTKAGAPIGTSSMPMPEVVRPPGPGSSVGDWPAWLAGARALG